MDEVSSYEWSRGCDVGRQSMGSGYLDELLRWFKRDGSDRVVKQKKDKKTDKVCW